MKQEQLKVSYTLCKLLYNQQAMFVNYGSLPITFTSIKCAIKRL